MVNWPFAWSPPIQTALRKVDSGDIGRVWQVKYRAAHAGPKELGCSEAFCGWLFDPALNGGGALIDYACYGCALARTILGMPNEVFATAGHYVKSALPVEDNATVLLRYPQASALAEASWSQQGDLTSYEAIFYGEDGTLVTSGRENGRLLRADAEHSEGRELPPLQDPPPLHLLNATGHLHWALKENRPFLPILSAEVGRDTQAILTAAQRASRLPGSNPREWLGGKP